MLDLLGSAHVQTKECTVCLLARGYNGAGKNMEMSRQLRTAAASLTTTADSSARCHMPNHARDPLIDQETTPPRSWPCARPPPRPHRHTDADSATPPPPAAAVAAAMAAAVLPRPPRPRLPMPRRWRRLPLTPGPLLPRLLLPPHPPQPPLPHAAAAQPLLHPTHAHKLPQPEAAGKRPEDSSLSSNPRVHGRHTGTRRDGSPAAV